MIARDQGSAPIGKLEATVDPGIIEDILMTATAYIISGGGPTPGSAGANHKEGHMMPRMANKERIRR